MKFEVDNLIKYDFSVTLKNGFDWFIVVRCGLPTIPKKVKSAFTDLKKTGCCDVLFNVFDSREIRITNIVGISHLTLADVITTTIEKEGYRVEKIKKHY